MSSNSNSPLPIPDWWLSPSPSTATLTDFQRAVLLAAYCVPSGKVATYGSVCDCLGRGCPQAAGQALTRNPYAPRIPCHRIVAANSIGGYAGGVSLDDKRIKAKIGILKYEGVAFNANMSDVSRTNSGNTVISGSELRKKVEHFISTHSKFDVKNITVPENVQLYYDTCK